MKRSNSYAIGALYDSLSHGETPQWKKDYNRRYYQKHKDYWREYYGTTPNYIRQHGYERRKELSDWEDRYAKEWDKEYANPLSEIHTPKMQMRLAVDRKIELDRADRIMNEEFSDAEKSLKKRYKALMNSDYDAATKASGTIAYGKRKAALVLEKANWKISKLKSAIKGLGKNPFK